jgi:hypothetical protein
MARVSTAMSAVPKPEGSEKPGKRVKPGKKEKGKRRAGAAVVAPAAGPTSRVNIALPFSQIRMQEPSQELADVVSLVGELVVALKDTLTASKYEEFEAQVDSLRARLR